MQYELLGDWLSLLSMFVSLHLCFECICNSLFFMPELYSNIWNYYTLYTLFLKFIFLKDLIYFREGECTHMEAGAEAEREVEII